MTYRDIDPRLAGIYIIKNNLNGKCYVGQSVKLRSRLKDHMRNAKSGKYDLPIYRAIKKYGFHNFTIDVLESFIPEPNITNKELIQKLDQLEIKYIEEYNAYTEGYNCTKGGDFGVLGLRMSQEQKKKISTKTKECIAKGIFGKRVYMYNFIEKYYIYAWTVTDASNITKVSHNNISRLCNNTYYRPFCSNFIAAFTKEELEEKKKHCPEYVSKIKCRSCSNNPSWYKGMIGLNKGKEMSQEQKEKLRITSTKYIVYQYDLNGNLINTYEGMHNAAKAVNTDYGSISRACRGRAKTCKGFIWKKILKQPDCKQVVTN